MANNLNAELIEKARQAKSPEELLALAKENGQKLTEESAKVYFEQLNKSGELSDNELNNVAGGGCHAKDGRLLVTTQNNCEAWVCKYCGKQAAPYDIWERYHYECQGRIVELIVSCDRCKYMSYEGGAWLCNNPANRG